MKGKNKGEIIQVAILILMLISSTHQQFTRQQITDSAQYLWHYNIAVSIFTTKQQDMNKKFCTVDKAI